MAVMGRISFSITDQASMTAAIVMGFWQSLLEHWYLEAELNLHYGFLFFSHSMPPAW